MNVGMLVFRVMNFVWWKVFFLEREFFWLVFLLWVLKVFRVFSFFIVFFFLERRKEFMVFFLMKSIFR